MGLVYLAKFLKCKDNPMSKIDNLFQVLEGLGTRKFLYDEAKCSNYPQTSWERISISIWWRPLHKEGTKITNVFGGTKTVYTTLVSLGRSIQIVS
jgi:hypothetical protein